MTVTTWTDNDGNRYFGDVDKLRGWVYYSDRHRGVKRLVDDHARAEFDRVEWECAAQAVHDVKPAAAIVNDFQFRHPNGLVWLPQPPRAPGEKPVEGLVLVPCWSPRKHRWVVFKCERAPGQTFRLIPLEVVAVTEGRTWLLQNPVDDPDMEEGIYHVDEEMHHRMDEAWDAANRWRSELTNAWALDADTSDAYMADEVAFSNEFVETVSIVQEYGTRRRLMEADD
jgi:hypothetical protein